MSRYKDIFFLHSIANVGKISLIKFVENFTFLIPLILFVPTPLFIDIVLYMMLGVDTFTISTNTRESFVYECSIYWLKIL